VKAAHVKQVPGRKADKADARWLAKLMCYGSLQASFIPPAVQRDPRDLTLYRTQLAQECGRKVNRVQGTLEHANITLAAVATNIFGGSGRAILAALIDRRVDPAMPAELEKGRLRSKLSPLGQALTGLARDHYRRLPSTTKAPCWEVWTCPNNAESPNQLSAAFGVRRFLGTNPLFPLFNDLYEAAEIIFWGVGSQPSTSQIGQGTPELPVCPKPVNPVSYRLYGGLIDQQRSIPNLLPDTPNV
jgi:Transposase